jgi:hypothetical protein
MTQQSPTRQLRRAAVQTDWLAVRELRSDANV